MFLADTLSRAFLLKIKKKRFGTWSLSRSASCNSWRIWSVQKHTSSITQKGWPENKEKVPEDVKIYWKFRDEISGIDGILYKNNKLIVPRSMRSQILETLHSWHLRIVKCKARAREVLFWPGMSSQIEEEIAKCSTCAVNSKQNPKEPMIITSTTDRSWSLVSIDLFEYRGGHYILCVDQYS